MQSANRKLLVEITYLTEFRKGNLMQENKGLDSNKQEESYGLQLSCR